ncbi:MAG: ASKHA domain-containing protein [Thermodesulfobacteriota bacterium]
MQYLVHFQPDNIRTEVAAGENLLAAAATAGVYIHAACGGDGVCGKCKVKIESGEVRQLSAGKHALKEEERKAGYCLACQSSVCSDLVVTVPAEGSGARATRPKPKTTKAISARSLDSLIGDWRLQPPVKKIFLRLPPPTLEDNAADLQRLMRGLMKELNADQEPSYDHPELLRGLPFILRESGWEVTVLLLRGKRSSDTDRIIAVEHGDTTGELYGLAVDIGTTTVCGVLMNLNTGEIMAEASAYNAQIEHGEDVISRIVYSQRHGGLKRLQQKVIRTLNEIIERVCRQVVINPSDIAYIMAAGNTTMSHLLLGLDPKFIREAPYVPTCSQFPLTRAADLGVLAHPSVRLFLYASPASYVGGDIVSGVHACQMYRSPEVTLFIDIGTNGEIVVGNRDWMVCAACSAGPAFEGGGIKHGMRASEGAIENFSIHPQTLEPMIVTIDQTRARGICGSGLIAIVAVLLETDVIDQRGKFNRNLDSPRIREGMDGYEYVLVWEKDAQGDRDIVITEVDLDNLMRAKGAMYAGYQTLLESVGMSFTDLDRIILAGNFGAYIDLERAITIGLLPDLDRDRFFYLGNGSLLGCQISMLDNDRFREREQVRRLLTHMELSENAQFMSHYVAALFLPHTDMRQFPTVKAKLDQLD